jgi:hypothetical protein
MYLDPERLLWGPEWAAARNGGYVCPQCGRWVQIHDRSLNRREALSAQLMDKLNALTPGRWVHISTEVRTGPGGEEHKLGYWGFIEERPTRAADRDIEEGLASPDDYPEWLRDVYQQGYPDAGKREKKHTGDWRITPHGIKWVAKEIAVPHYVPVYNARPLCAPRSFSLTGKTAPDTSIEDALRTPTDESWT